MIKIGASLTLEPVHSDKQETYRCKIVELDDAKIWIDYPIHRETGKTLFLIDGTQLKAKFVVDEVPYMFDTEVLGRVKKNIPMITLHYPGKEELLKIQRRQFVRVEATIDVAVEGNEFLQFSTVTDDISAGGCAINLPKGIELVENSDLKLLLVLPMQTGDYHYLSVNAKAIRVLQKDQQRLASIQFKELEEASMQFIMRYCFERQLVLRRKGYINS
ncbi:flagellar brake protein [Bacillus sp. 2205SS5-2]|uniref:flagellar brake protein n=1 Tax=Bacillus sp. 2205SS5-2 TaxID=3109031 RepID=UPI0030073F36